MADLKYTYIDLTNASIDMRKHERDIVPPGLVEALNLMPSVSDKKLTLRHDFEMYEKDIASFKSSIYRNANISQYLNSIAGIYGSDTLVYFTNIFPLDTSGETYPGITRVVDTILSATVDNSTVKATLTDGSATVAIDDNAVNVNQKAYRGAIITFDTQTSSDTYHIIDEVQDDGTILLERPIVASDFSDVSDIDFQIIQNHSYKLGDYKIHVEDFLTNTIYGTAGISDDFSYKDIAGPWSSARTVATPADAFDVSYIEAFPGIDDYHTNLSYSTGYQQNCCATGDNICVANVPFDTGTVLAYINRALKWTTSPSLGMWESIYPIDPNGYTIDDDHSQASMVVWDDAQKKFYVPYISNNGGEYWLNVIDLTDSSSGPTVTYHTKLEDVTGTGFTAACGVDSTNGVLYVQCVTSGAGSADVTVKAVNVSTWGVSDVTLPEAMVLSGITHSPTDDSVLFSGVDQSNNRTHYHYKASSFNKLTGVPTGSSGYAASLYDDGSSFFYFIPTGGDLYYWTSGGTYAVTKGLTATGGNVWTTVSDVAVIDDDGTDTADIFLFVSGALQDNYTEASTLLTNFSGISVIQFNKTGPAFTFITDVCNIGDEAKNISKVFTAPNTSYDARYYFGLWGDYLNTSPENTLGQYVINHTLGETITWDSGDFAPISDDYRWRAFGVLNAYVVGFGEYAYDSDTDTWGYTPRRLRWTAPATVNDFASSGTGTLDAIGDGEFMDARSVNGRIVTFESNAVGALVPRGITDDPWDYEIIQKNIRIISNPVVVDDIVYFINKDGLLYSSNGVSVKETGSSFDITKYDDFNEKKPVWLTYCNETNSLVAFQAPDSLTYDLSVGYKHAYFISLTTGSTTRITLPRSQYSAGSPRSIVGVERSVKKNLIVSYNPSTLTSSYISTASLNYGGLVTGIDKIRDDGNGTDSSRWYAELETGLLFIEPEGVKSFIRQGELYTYTDAYSDGSGPKVIVGVKSIEDSDYTWNCSSTAMTTTASAPYLYITNNSSVSDLFSNKIEVLTGVQSNYLPWTQPSYRVYSSTDGSTFTQMSAVSYATVAAGASSSQFAYGVSGDSTANAVSTNVGAGVSVYVYSENEPDLWMAIGDAVYLPTEQQYKYLKSSFSDAYTATMDSNATYSETAPVVYHTDQISNNDSRLQFGIKLLSEGVSFKIRIVPIYILQSSGELPRVIKPANGIMIGYLPMAQKTFEATGE